MNSDKVVEKYPEVYDYILQQETNYRTERVPLASNWTDWNMYEHVDRSYQLKNSKFYKGPQDYTRPFHNIILPIANVAYRMEGFDVKDVELYVDNADDYHKSFLARKFHDRWAKENKIDTAIDETVVSFFDYGLALLKDVDESRPEVVPLQTIAFCDQADIMAGPICLKHYYSIDQLLDMNWDKDAIQRAITLSKTTQKVAQSNGQTKKSPEKLIEVYELHGVFPESWLGEEKMGDAWQDTGKYTRQMHLITFYTGSDDVSKKGITFFKGKSKQIFKALKRDEIQGRACGRGGIEELFMPQIWANWSAKQITEILEAIATVFWTSNDKKLTNQKIKDMRKQQIIFLDDGKDLVPKQVTNAASKIPFDQFMNVLEQNARVIGAASDPALGLNPVSGTPLGTTEIVTQQGQGIHEYRRGQIAAFWGEIYVDWVLPHLAKEINKGSTWLDELSLDELQSIAEKVAVKEANRRVTRLILAGGNPTQEQIDLFKQLVKQDFMKGGNKKFLQVMKDEFKNLPMDIKVSVAGKQEALFEVVSKLNGIFRAVFTPVGIQVLQSSPAASELLNQILEKSGLSPIDFASLNHIKAPMQQAPAGIAPQNQPLPVTS